MGKRVRVLVVDDSAFMRHSVSQVLAADGDLEVVGTAKDGVQALELVDELRPDVVTLDVEMPRMDGLTTLRRLMSARPLPVVMLSSSTTAGASTTLTALELGAVDFVTKPSGPISLNIREVGPELVAKVKAAATARVRHADRRPDRPAPREAPSIVPSAQPSRKVVVIGSSTGGPKALYEVVPALPSDLDASLVIVQHMPAGFTRSLAEKLDDLSTIRIKEAENGDRLRPGLGLVAPGGRHLVVGAGGVAHLADWLPVHGVRPAIDVTLDSAVQVFGAACLAVILTGMGSDGTQGCRQVRAAGGKVIAEDESTCVVYGMPRSVVEAGLADGVVPIEAISREIVRFLRQVGTSTMRPRPPGLRPVLE